MRQRPHRTSTRAPSRMTARPEANTRARCIPMFGRSPLGSVLVVGWSFARSATIRPPTTPVAPGEHEMKIAYVYFMHAEPERVGPLVPRHVAYWQGRALTGYEGGPFGDRSGGLITFDADSLDAAARLADADPFAIEGVLGERWVKEWATER